MSIKSVDEILKRKEHHLENGDMINRIKELEEFIEKHYKILAKEYAREILCERGCMWYNDDYCNKVEKLEDEIKMRHQLILHNQTIINGQNEEIENLEYQNEDLQLQKEDFHSEIEVLHSIIEKLETKYKSLELKYEELNKPSLEKIEQNFIKIESYNQFNFNRYYFDIDTETIVSIREGKSGKLRKQFKPTKIKCKKLIVALVDINDIPRAINYDELIAHYQDIVDSLK